MTAEYDPEVNVIPVLAVIKTFGKCMKEDGKFHKAGDYKIAFGRLLTACGTFVQKSRVSYPAIIHSDLIYFIDMFDIYIKAYTLITLYFLYSRRNAHGFHQWYFEESWW